METKDFLKKFSKIVKDTLNWGGFTVCEIIISVLNLLLIGAVVYYCYHVFGPVERIEPKIQSVSIKKVDGFYLIDKRLNSYSEETFPDCKIKFYDRVLEFKNGDIYDCDNCVTNKVSIQKTDGGFRVYYLNHSYPLATLTKINWYYVPPISINRQFEKKEMYAKDGKFYIDTDERHEFVYFLLLAIVIFLIFVSRSGVVLIVKSLFEEEHELTKQSITKLRQRFNKK